MQIQNNSVHRITTGSILVTLGIAFGDIGTSPLYVLRAVTDGQVVSSDLVLGTLSCIFWTLTLLATFKYVVITLQADNKGEGGIFALYTLLKRLNLKWLIFPALIGSSTLLADGFITPAISVASAVEGLKVLNPSINTVPIIIGILFLLFFIQKFGTQLVGKFFGPIMVTWFIMLGALGISSLGSSVEVLKALNPYYAYRFIFHVPRGFWLLASVFLATTGAETLYSDLGHCGKGNIRLTWFFVKAMILLNYFGQGAWLLRHQGQVLHEGITPFYALMPSWFMPIGVCIAMLATIVASQGVISGSFTLINEAIRLNFWPKLKVLYPTEFKGQVYIAAINWFLCLGCILTVLYFRESSHMESAYGLSIIVTMLMTTVLLIHFLRTKKFPLWIIGCLAIFYVSIEASFLVASLSKLLQGGWVTLLLAGVLSMTMWVYFKAKKILNRYTGFVKIDDYIDTLTELSNDTTITKYATNLVFMTSAGRYNNLEDKIIYSILRKQPKRADIYWFIHIEHVDEPYCMEYRVTQFVPNKIIRIDFRFGFRVDPRINFLFRQVVKELVANKEVDIMSRYASLSKQNVAGDFRFIVIKKSLSSEYDLPLLDRLVMSAYFFIQHFSIAEEKAFGLDTSNITIEYSPIFLYHAHPYESTLKRMQ